jgi:glycerol uptake facilitator-like aquaporin
MAKAYVLEEAPAYLAAQVLGGIAGVAVAHLMFGLPLLEVSQNVRSGLPLMFSEFVAAFGLLAVIWGTGKQSPPLGAACVAAYIAGAYWFTASTSFANPAVTLARALTDTFSGIQPADVPAFILAQVLGAVCATLLFGWLVPADR